MNPPAPALARLAECALQSHDPQSWYRLRRYLPTLRVSVISVLSVPTAVPPSAFSYTTTPATQLIGGGTSTMEP